MPSILPTQTFPDFTVPTVDGDEFQLSQRLGDNFTLLVFYRGLHCPICKMQLRELQRKLGDFAERDVTVVAISMDERSRAEQTVEDWDVGQLTIGYGMEEELAQRLGLYISAGRPDSKEPEIFSEPGMFLVRPDQTLYLASIQSMPFTRPPFDQLLQGIDYALENDYPARGERAETELA